MGIFNRFLPNVGKKSSALAHPHVWTDDELTRDINKAKVANTHASRHLESTIKDLLDSVNIKQELPRQRT